jgi:kynureninase
VASAVDYRTGRRADIAGTTAAVHEAGALVCWDLSHAIGSVEVDLTASDADLAVGCTYKHICAGPGAPAFLYARRELQPELASPIWGWFAQRDQFAMGPAHDPEPGIRRFLTGTPNVFGLLAVDEGVRLVAEAGVERLQHKATTLTRLVITLADAWLEPLGFQVASPRIDDERGAHVALSHPDAYRIARALLDRDVVVDVRPPDLLRVGPAPISTRHTDVWDGLDRLRTLVATGAHLEYSDERGRVT